MTTLYYQRSGVPADARLKPSRSIDHGVSVVSGFSRTVRVERKALAGRLPCRRPLIARLTPAREVE